jgi:CRISPR-associated protein Csd2
MTTSAFSGMRSRILFENDRSAARGLMTTRKLFVFQHESPLGNAQAADLFDRISIKRKDGVEAPRSFNDYVVGLNDKDLPAGVTVQALV